MIPLFNIENYVIDTSKFDHALHDSGVLKFEESFAEYVGARYACSVNSATSAIFLIFLNKNIKVNVPSIIPPVVLNALYNAGNTINFVDNVDWVGDSYILHEFADYKVIDSAQKVKPNQFQLEANPNDLMLFSFYPTKPVGSLDGGMIVSNDYEKISYFKEAVMNGMSYNHNNWDRRIKFPGWKMYLNSFQAAIAAENLKKLPNKLEHLEYVRDFYNAEFGLNNNSDHLYRIEVSNNAEVIAALEEVGISCGIHYAAMHLHPVYGTISESDCPRSEKIEKSTLSIPFNEKLTKKNLQDVVKHVRGWMV